MLTRHPLVFLSGSQGLGVIKGVVARFPVDTGLSVPHMGWNGVRAAPGSSLPSFWSLDASEKVYFVHSYRVAPTGVWHLRCCWTLSYNRVLLLPMLMLLLLLFLFLFLLSLLWSFAADNAAWVSGLTDYGAPFVRYYTRSTFFQLRSSADPFFMCVAPRGNCSTVWYERAW